MTLKKNKNFLLSILLNIYYLLNKITSKIRNEITKIKTKEMIKDLILNKKRNLLLRNEILLLPKKINKDSKRYMIKEGLNLYRLLEFVHLKKFGEKNQEICYKMTDNEVFPYNNSYGEFSFKIIFKAEDLRGSTHVYHVEISVDEKNQELKIRELVKKRCNDQEKSIKYIIRQQKFKIA